MMNTTAGTPGQPADNPQIQLLTKGDIPAFLALQDRVLRALDPRREANHLKPRTAEDLAAHMDAGMPAIGLTAGGRLVAQALLAFPYVPVVPNLGGLPALHQKFTVVQAVSVDPGFTNRGLMKRLLQAAEAETARTGHDSMVAKIALTNLASLRGFLSRDFRIISFGNDPDSLYRCAYVRKRVAAAAAAAPLLQAA